MVYERNTEAQNLESTVLPLLSICNMTSDFHKDIPTRSFSSKYSLLNLTAELPEHKTPQLLKLISECQESFEKEAEILIQNDLSYSDIEILFSKYKQFLVGTYVLKSDIYDPNHAINIDVSDRSWAFDDSIISFANTTCDTSYNNTLREYDIEHASMLLTSDVLDGSSSNSMEFESSELYNDTDFFQKDFTFSIDDGMDTACTPVTHLSSPQPSSSNNSQIFGTHFVNVKRNRITREAKDILEAIFKIKPFPNTAERRLIAKKCGLTPTQVRIWFTNTRAR
ncbi:hypothetical protein CANINC_000410, partial [Pichia inconspicua]